MKPRRAKWYFTQDELLECVCPCLPCRAIWVLKGWLGVRNHPEFHGVLRRP